MSKKFVSYKIVTHSPNDVKWVTLARFIAIESIPFIFRLRESCKDEQLKLNENKRKSAIKLEKSHNLTLQARN